MSIANQSAYDRAVTGGVRSAPVIDLLALILARAPEDVEACESDARSLAKRFQGARLSEIAAADLKATTGLEQFEAFQRLAAIELGRRAAEASKGERVSFDCYEAVVSAFQYLENEKQEHFCAAYLDSKNNVIHRSTIHIGTVNMSVVGPREVFREAVRENAASIIVVHNHPSGDPTPSPEDFAVTKKLKEVGDLLDIPLLDHVIIGHGMHVSLRKLGAL